MTILGQSKLKPLISKAETLEDLNFIDQKRAIDQVILNPSLVQHHLKSFLSIKNQVQNSQWLGLVYAYFDTQVLSQFDAVISISDSPETIVACIQTLMEKNSGKEAEFTQNVISEREIEVLKLLATGLSNKEIADKLNISINTVITHRKNITQKTGIKTISGLTIYAVLKNMISVDGVLK